MSDDEKEAARRAFRDALAALPQGTARARLETARDNAVKPVTAEHEHRERCAKIIRSVANELAREVEEVREDCKEIVSEALGKLATGTSEQQIREHCNELLKPLRDAIAKRDRAKAEEKQRQTEQERQDAEQRRRKTDAESRLRCLSEIGSANPIYRYLRELERREEIALIERLILSFAGGVVGIEFRRHARKSLIRISGRDFTMSSRYAIGSRNGRVRYSLARFGDKKWPIESPL